MKKAATKLFRGCREFLDNAAGGSWYDTAVKDLAGSV